ncbi:MAG: phosphoribosylanthranilate isomerase [Ignavibacteriaceae bacterium]|nr:phosphoribosylanthranilate isomerase [Ignavibacteriaceae bacterium]
MKIKICGITNINDALLCEKLGADALGFIFYPKSKRFIEPSAAKEIIRKLSPFTMKIGVFVNELADTINEIGSDIKLNAIQLHGDESPDTVRKIVLPVIKSFRVGTNFNYSIINQYNNVSYLFDSYSPIEFGGTGKKFDWEEIPLELRNKIILSGGIKSANLEYIYQNIKPAAIDLSSSVESIPGRKDEKKLKEFFNLVDHFRKEID